MSKEYIEDMADEEIYATWLDDPAYLPPSKEEPSVRGAVFAIVVIAVFFFCMWYISQPIF